MFSVCLSAHKEMGWYPWSLVSGTWSFPRTVRPVAAGGGGGGYSWTWQGRPPWPHRKLRSCGHPKGFTCSENKMKKKFSALNSGCIYSKIPITGFTFCFLVSQDLVIFQRNPYFKQEISVSVCSARYRDKSKIFIRVMVTFYRKTSRNEEIWARGVYPDYLGSFSVLEFRWYWLRKMQYTQHRK